MRIQVKLIALLIIFSATSLVGCVGLQVDKNPQRLYEQAIVDAAVVSPEKIMPLLPIPVAQNVTVISWVTDSRTPCKSGESQCEFTSGTDRIWVTLDGEVKNLCQSWHLHDDALRIRLEQLLGLPPNSPQQYRKVKFVVMKVPHERLERACLGVNANDAAHPQCTLATQNNTPDDLRNYVQQQMAGSYVVHNPNGPGYPFTRLGYTYDWNAVSDKQHHYGASEFLIMPNTAIKVREIFSTDEYCKQP